MKDKLFIRLIFTSGLIDSVSLSKNERYFIEAYVKENRSIRDISQDLGLSNQRIQQISKSTIGKTINKIQELILNSEKLAKLSNDCKKIEQELFILKRSNSSGVRFKTNVTTKNNKPSLQLEEMPFSVRARKALKELNVNDVKSLKKLTITKLRSTYGVGIKIIDEINRRAESIGVFLKE